LAFWLLLLTVLGEIFMPHLMVVLAQGFDKDPAKLALTITLSRIAFPYLLLVCLVALLSGVLYGLDRFAAASAAPVVYNVVCIGFMVGLTRFMPTAGHAFALGISAAGVIMLGMLIIACHRAGMPIRLQLPRITPQMRMLFRRMGPGLVGAGVTQINQMVDVFIATLLPAGTVSVLYYANQVQQLPLAIIGTAVGTALLPLMSRQVRQGETENALGTMNRALEYALFLTVPAAVALMVVPGPVVAALFQHGVFSAEDVRLSAQSLLAYGTGLPAFVLVKVLAPSFFARGDTSTPVKVGVACVALNLGLNLAFMRPLHHMGPPLATAIAAWANYWGLMLVLQRRGHFISDRRLKQRSARIFLAALMMGVALFVFDRWIGGALHGRFVRYLQLFSIVFVGGGVYIVTAGLLRAFEPKELLGLMRRRRRA
jgi:putative peptidoglycan lipid II flippase